MSKSYVFVEALEERGSPEYAHQVATREVNEWAAKGYDVSSWQVVPETTDSLGFYAILMEKEGEEGHSHDEE